MAGCRQQKEELKKRASSRRKKRLAAGRSERLGAEGVLGLSDIYISNFGLGLQIPYWASFGLHALVPQMGNRDRDSRNAPAPASSVGDHFLPAKLPVGIKFIPFPSP